MKNFIPINRKIFDNYLWLEKRKYSKFEAWLDLLQMVSFSNDNKNLINGSMCRWGRGQYPISISFLAKRWGWTDKPVRNYVKVLEKESMILLKKENKWTMLTICKYDNYNKTGQSEGKSEGNQKAIKGQELNNINNINNINKDKKEILDIWLNYRKEIKKSINNESTLKTLIDKFNSEPLEKVKVVVNNSIENQWQGLFWDKYNNSSTDTSNETIFERMARIEQEAKNGY